MSSRRQIDHAQRRQIYEFIERNGAVRPETVRQNVLVHPETASKPTRAGPNLDPSMPMPMQEFSEHVSRLERAGYLDEEDGKYRVSIGTKEETTTVDIGDNEAEVRLARQEDIRGIIDVIEEIATEETHVVASRLADRLDRDGVLLRHNDDEDRVFFVATVDDDPVGWLHVEGVRFPAMDHIAELTLGVQEQYRGHTLGTTLMKRGLEWARREEYRKVYQNLPETNDQAVSFLEEQGWSIESRREGHYCIDGELVDEIQLARWLSQ